MDFTSYFSLVQTSVVIWYAFVELFGVFVTYWSLVWWQWWVDPPAAAALRGVMLLPGQCSFPFGKAKRVLRLVLTFQLLWHYATSCQLWRMLYLSIDYLSINLWCLWLFLTAEPVLNELEYIRMRYQSPARHSFRGANKTYENLTVRSDCTTTTGDGTFRALQPSTDLQLLPPDKAPIALDIAKNVTDGSYNEVIGTTTPLTANFNDDQKTWRHYLIVCLEPDWPGHMALWLHGRFWLSCCHYSCRIFTALSVCAIWLCCV